MKTRPSHLFALALSVMLALAAPLPQAAAPAELPRPMELADILAWKSVATPLLSNDGAWFAYRLTPLDGDSEVVVRQVQGDKEYRFAAGDVRGGGGGGAPNLAAAAGSSLAFSDDSKWVAFTIAPTQREAAQLRRQRRPAQNKVRLLDLTTGSDVTFEKIRRFAFSGEKAAWLALHKYGADTPGASAAGPAAAAPPPAAAGAAAAPERPRGSDLILHELATGNDLNVGNVAEFAFDKGGRFLAWTIDAQDQMGNGIALRSMESGAVLPLDSGKASYERLTWTEKGDGLAVLKGTEDKRYRDKVYAVLGFDGFGAAAPQKTDYDPAEDKTFPEGMAVSPNRNPQWTEALDAITFGIRSPRKAEARPGDKPAGAPGEKPEVKPGEKPEDKPGEKREVKPGEKPAPASEPADDEERPNLVIWHHKDPRLQSQQQVQETSDRNFSYLCIYRVKEKKFLRLADDSVRQVTLTPKERFAIGFDVRDYELSGNLDGRRYQDVYSIDLATGERTLVLKRARYVNSPSTDGTKLLYYEDGHFYSYDLVAGKPSNLTLTVPTSFVDTEDDHNVTKPPRSALGWTAEGDAVILSDGWDLWKVPVAGGAAVNLTVNGKKEGIRYRRPLRFDPDERGWDLSVTRYVDMFGEYTKKGGIGRLAAGKPGIEPLVFDEASYNVTKAKKADVFLYSRSTPSDPPDYYAADASLKGGRRLTTSGDQVKAFSWSGGARLIEYSVQLGKGGPVRKLQGSLFLPANYEKGKSYPTLVYIYEKLTQGHYGFTTPAANGFNKSVYTSNGYAVLMPDITYRVNDPGMSAVWCVTAAVKAAIATGIVDPKRIGIQGHSWGGYQTSFLVTQTDLFAAAVAGAPLTNMVSMYSLIYKNSGGTNQPIFESSQGRFLGGYWDNWEAYVRNSPVNFAKNVKTPLLILHNDRDGAVDFTQGVEYYNTLRRLGKTVVLLEYPGENHSLARPANQRDYTVRMKEFFDHHLIGKPAPEWLVKGVPRLEMEEHLKQRQELQKKAAPAQPTKPTTSTAATR